MKVRKLKKMVKNSSRLYMFTVVKESDSDSVYFLRSTNTTFTKHCLVYDNTVAIPSNKVNNAHQEIDIFRNITMY